MMKKYQTFLPFRKVKPIAVGQLFGPPVFLSEPVEDKAESYHPQMMIYHLFN